MSTEMMTEGDPGPRVLHNSNKPKTLNNTQN